VAQTVVYVIGVFDLFHRGHVELLRRARELGDKLIVAINSDKLTEEYKRRPFFSEEDRLEIVRACRFVDEAFIATEYDNSKLVLKHKVNKIVHGDEWSHESYLKQICLSPEFLVQHKIEMVYLPYWSSISTSELIRVVQASTKLEGPH
jgi:glycerol-3-phosphate cytidylyltransferase